MPVLELSAPARLEPLDRRLVLWSRDRGFLRLGLTLESVNTKGTAVNSTGPRENTLALATSKLGPLQRPYAHDGVVLKAS